MSEEEFIKMIMDSYDFTRCEICEALIKLKDNQELVAQAAMLAHFSEMSLELAVQDVIMAYRV